MFLDEPGEGYGSFTDLEVWKQARALKLEVYRLLQSIPVSDADLRSQLRRAARSVPANISEGHGRGTWRDELRFCVIARGSLKETLNHLIDGFDCGYFTREQLAMVKPSADRTGRLLNGYIAHLKRQLQNQTTK